MKGWLLAGTVLVVTALPASLLAEPLEHRWVYLPTNLLVDKNVDEGLAILARAAQAGYTGVVLTDSKFFRWDQLPDRYLTNVQRFRQAVRKLGLACVVWDESCQKSGLTPGQLLAENVRKCAGLIRAEDPGKAIYVWSDMFDPHHNARKTGAYYLVKGQGPWYGSWEGLDKDLVIVNWNSGPGQRLDSLRHFADRGHRQILAGYYDGPVGAIRDWLRDAQQVQGVTGVMYTTWRHQYRDLERFAAQLPPQGH